MLSAPILLNLVFFVLLAMMSGGLYNYSVVAFGALYGTPVATANAALTGNLLLSAIGVLIGGLLVGRTTRHGLVATLGLAGIALFVALVAQFDLGSLALIAAMSAAGFCSGVIMPSRDMIVREVTPPGSFGKVFGFVTTGFNIGGIISPLIFGAIMDHGSPRLVFLAVAAFSLIAIVTVVTRPARGRLMAAVRPDLSNRPNCPMSGPRALGRRPFRRAAARALLGDSSTVEHRTLTPRISGSNPGPPASLKYSCASGSGADRRASPALRLRQPVGARQIDVKDRAAAGRVVEPDLALHAHDDLPHDAQPKAGAAFLLARSRCRPARISRKSAA